MELGQACELMKLIFPDWDLKVLSQQESAFCFQLSQKVDVPYPGTLPVSLKIVFTKFFQGSYRIEFFDSECPKPVFKVAELAAKAAIAAFVAKYNARTLQPVADRTLRSVMNSNPQRLKEIWDAIPWESAYYNKNLPDSSTSIEIFWEFEPEDAAIYFAQTREQDEWIDGRLERHVTSRSAYWVRYPYGQCIVVVVENWKENLQREIV